MPKISDEERFNETLQNLLKTPPEPHKPLGKEKPSPQKRATKRKTKKKGPG